MTAILEPKKKLEPSPLRWGEGGRKNQEKLFTSISFARSATCEIYSPFNVGRRGRDFPTHPLPEFSPDAEKPHFPHYFILSSSSPSSDWHTFQFSFTEEKGKLHKHCLTGFAPTHNLEVVGGKEFRTGWWKLDEAKTILPLDVRKAVVEGAT